MKRPAVRACRRQRGRGLIPFGRDIASVAAVPLAVYFWGGRQGLASHRSAV